MSRASRGEAALAGLAAGAMTLGVAEVLAGLWGRLGTAPSTLSPLLAVADSFVDRTPPWLKDFAIATFGTADKVALVVGIALVLTAACVGIGLLARRRLGAGLVVFALVGAVGIAAVLSRPGAAPTATLPTLVGVAVGLFVLRRLLRDPTTRTAQVELPSDLTRRSVLVAGGVLAAAGLLGILAGRALSGAGEVVRAARAAFVVPRAAAPATDPAAGDQGVPGQTSCRTPNESIYRTDTAVLAPQADQASW